MLVPADDFAAGTAIVVEPRAIVGGPIGVGVPECSVGLIDVIGLGLRMFSVYECKILSVVEVPEYFADGVPVCGSWVASDSGACIDGVLDVVPVHTCQPEEITDGFSVWFIFHVSSVSVTFRSLGWAVTSGHEGVGDGWSVRAQRIGLRPCSRHLEFCKSF